MFKKQFRTFIKRNDLRRSQVNVSGTVTLGLGAARELGFPTINVAHNFNGSLTTGIYAASAELQGRTWRGVAVVGGDFVQSMRPKLEIHLFEPCGAVADEPITIALFDCIGALEKISSRHALIKKIERDIVAARAWWANN